MSRQPPDELILAKHVWSPGLCVLCDKPGHGPTTRFVNLLLDSGRSVPMVVCPGHALRIDLHALGFNELPDLPVDELDAAATRLMLPADAFG